jgi:hypothetical protein
VIGDSAKVLVIMNYLLYVIAQLLVGCFCHFFEILYHAFNYVFAVCHHGDINYIIF